MKATKSTLNSNVNNIVNHVVNHVVNHLGVAAIYLIGLTVVLLQLRSIF